MIILSKECRRCRSKALKIRKKVVYIDSDGTKHVQYRQQCQDCGTRHDAIPHATVEQLASQFSYPIENIPAWEEYEYTRNKEGV